MLKHFKKYLIAVLIILLAPNFALASYEVIKAKTVENKNLENKKDEIIRTANDPEIPKFREETSISSKLSQKTRNFFSKKRKKEIEEQTVTEQETKTENNSEVQTVDDKNKFEINADKLTYDDTEGNVYAKGNVEIIAKSQDVVLKADSAVLDKTAQTITLRDNVRIIKDGSEMIGEYMLVDLNEQNILMDNPVVEAYSFTLKAQEGYLIANDLQMINGQVINDNNQQFAFTTMGFQALEPLGAQALHDASLNDTSDLKKNKQVYTLKAKEIVLTSHKDHDTLALKGSTVMYNNHKILHNSDIEIISDKQNQVIETNAPQAGTLRGFGTYIGYGLAYKLPMGQTLKLMPSLVYGDSNFGVGIIGRHQSLNSMTEAGWATSTSNLVLRGKYNFGKNLSLRYGRNAYLSDGFMGSRRSKYAAQLEYQKFYEVKDLDAKFAHGFYVGMFSDYYKKPSGHYYTTSRFRYNAQITKNLFTYENKEQDMSFKLGAVAQGSATVYGSGETAGVARIGPSMTTKVKKWESAIAYYLAGMHGDSPFIFDKYRYGKSSISLNEKFNFNNKIALGYRAVISPLKDNYEEDLMTESRLYAMVGPQDLKFAVSYDFVRDIAHIDLMFMLGADSTKINFDKLTTKNMDTHKKQDFYKRKKKIEVTQEVL